MTHPRGERHLQGQTAVVEKYRQLGKSYKEHDLKIQAKFAISFLTFEASR